jgi:hypothetical protein
MRLVYADGGRRGYDGGVHPVPEDRTTLSVICCLSHGRALRIRWVYGDGCIGPGEQVGVAAVADLEGEDRWKGADRDVVTPGE